MRHHLLAFFALVITVTVSARADSCMLGSVAPLSFSDFTGTTIRVTSTITFQCTQGTAFQIQFGPGLHSSANAGMRAMSDATDTLGYQIFADAAGNVALGTSANVNTLQGTGTGAQQTAILYGTLPAGQYAGAGTYADSVTATITGAFTSSSLPLNVSATVMNSCSIAATPMAFGIYTGEALASTSTVTATCTRGTSYSIGLSAGTSAHITQRILQGPGSATLLYNLYTDPGHTSVWGETPRVDTRPGTGTGLAQAFPVYGLLAASQRNPAAGSYADTITVTLTY